MQSGYGQEAWALWGEVASSRVWRDSVSRYHGTGKPKSMCVVLGKGVAMRTSRGLITRTYEGDGDCVC